MNKQKGYIGIDIGSISTKGVIIDDKNNILASEFEEKIEKTKKMPQDIENKLNKKLIENISMAIAIIVYFMSLIFGKERINATNYTNLLKTYTMCLGILSIIIFEFSYKKESVKSMYTGIEVLILSIVTMFSIYICKVQELKYIFYLALFAYEFSIYYLIKDILIYNKTKKEYLKTLTDIEEITKKEEPQKAKVTSRKRK